ncbi:flagellar hook-length control protein FliK [Rhodocyclaceae bacterium SMB388]
MTHPVMNRGSGAAVHTILAAIQPASSNPAGSPGFSRIFEQSVGNQQHSSAPPGPDRSARPEAGRGEPGSTGDARRPSDPPARTGAEQAASPQSGSPEASSASAAPHASGTKRSDATPADAQATRDGAPEVPASAAQPSGQQDLAADGDAQAPRDEPPQLPAFAAQPPTAELQDPAAVPTAADDGEIDPAITAGIPANLAALTAIIAALAKGANSQGLPTDVTTTADDGSTDGIAWKPPGTVLATLLKGDATTGASPDGADDGSAKDAVVRQWKTDFLPGAGAPGRSVAQVATTLSAQTGAHAQLPGVPAAALQAVAADGQPASGIAHTGVIPGLRGEPANIPQLQIHTPAGQRAWAEDIGSRMVWLVGRGESRAELVLTPPSLGKLGISIQVSGEQTTAHFVTSTAAARDALEQALPRLRELMQQAGINLGQADVSTSSDRQASGDEGMSSARRAFGLARNAAGQANIALPMMGTGDNWPRAGAGVIDTFA